ncbi:5-methylcytosine-specific restriction enzyme subunit McrC [Novipirellula galeiformis]|uniref:5-methylcytosine-specific restriction enzyme subunit McrC n=1 Tax=Novipirellula galeiformis TaxID=2528004 RepID=A0A5C6CDB0_9BACT|nr:hypothetical protein [Novipirellula galeiformis]TWU21717.1 5-methylcytosine-specific restriction enzyme subunit McrC [Novipirellula galeiformis]
MTIHPAAIGAVIEASQIPIQNIYYLLAYAHEQAKFAGDVPVGADECPDALNLIALVLSQRLLRVPRYGMDRRYQDVEEESSRLRGRIDFFASRRRLTQLRGSMICHFDELSIDTPANQIIHATCRMLLASGDALTKKNRELVSLSETLFRGVTPIQVSPTSFQQVRLTRNTNHYRIPIDLCRMLMKLSLPTQSGEKKRFRDLLRTRNTMNRLFEDFIKGFAQFHLPHAKVSKKQVPWNAKGFDGAESVLPKMETDVTIDLFDHKLIIECKFYKDGATTSGASVYDGGGLRSNHLYQLLAYLNHQSVQPGWSKVKGMLLYPTVNEAIDYHFSILGHDVRVRSLDLNQPWQQIEKRLLQILKAGWDDAAEAASLGH